MDRSAHAPSAHVLDDVRTRCRAVTEQAALVHVEGDRLDGYARELRPLVRRWSPAGSAPGGTDDPWAVHMIDDPEDRAALVLALATINFGSGYHPVVRKRSGLSGARTMAAGLHRWADDQPVTAARLSHLSAPEAHHVFAQPEADESVAELMALFAAALNDLGNLVTESHDGSFTALVAAADHSAARLVTLLDQLPFFRDVAAYRGRVVPFYKRAQLAACDLDRAFAGTGLGTFTDLDDLTAFADNLVPHVLRVDGLLRYEPELAEAIDAGDLIDHGSEAEVEIRAAGIHVVEELRRTLADQGTVTRSSDLDMILWWRGSNTSYKAIPRHRTRTVFY